MKRYGKKHSDRCLLLFLILVLITALLPLTGCDAFRRSFRHTETLYFDTPVTLLGYETKEAEFTRACDLLRGRLACLDGLFDAYAPYGDTVNLYRLNQSAGGEALQVPDELFGLLVFCKEAARLTEGRVDPAMGAVTFLWQEARETAQENGGEAPPPTEEALRAAAGHCDMEQLELDPVNRTARIADPEMRLDVGAVAKGYAADLLAADLRAAGFDGYALSMGGNLITVGEKPFGQKWQMGILDPADAEQTAVTVPLGGGMSLVTSGGYLRCFTWEGKTYHHIIDPATLYPSDSDVASVTVMGSCSALCDALSTCLYQMDVAQGQAWFSAFVDRLREAESDAVTGAFWIDRDGNTARVGM